MLDKIKALLAGDSAATVSWLVAFTGVAILVGLGKVEPNLLENLLFAMGGAVATKVIKNGQSNQ